MIGKKYNRGRRYLLQGLAGFGAANLANLTLGCRSRLQSSESNIDSVFDNDTQGDAGASLRQIAASKGIIYGGFPQLEYSKFILDTEFKNIFIREYGLLVGGFFGVTVGPFEGNTYDFQQTEPFFDFAVANDLAFRGHPIIWNEYNSAWLVEKFKASDTTTAEIDRIFVDRIKTLTKRYAGKVHSWDVVNEAISVDDGRKDNLKDTAKSGIRGEIYPAWLNYLGPDYIERAFRIAHEVDPQAILTYNDNGLVYSNIFGSSWEGKRRTAVLKLLERLKAKGTPIHALGIQSHLEGRRIRDFDENKFSQFLSDVASMGLKIIISELDVGDRQLPRDLTARDRQVAEAYYQYLSVVLDQPAVIAVISWGLSDRYTWLSDFSPRDDKAAVRPLLFDREYLPKPAWKAVARALKEAPER